MHYIIAILALLGLILPLLAQNDLSAERAYLRDYLRVRGDAAGGETVYYWTGRVYGYVPDEKKRELFGFSGFNIARSVVKPEGFELLTREAAFFLDPVSGEILETWQNPFTGRSVRVQQIWNDPVNQDLTFGDEYLPLVSKILPSEELGEQLVFYHDIFPFYPNPLPRERYPEFAQSDNYQSAEFFQFFVDQADLADTALNTVPASISWTRLSPWMPFMRMGDRAGLLVFVCRGRKLEGGFDALPAYLKDYVLARHPEYAQAPQEVTGPNVTSWTYFRQLLESGQIEP